MKVLTKTLLAGILSLTLVACGTTDEEESAVQSGNEEEANTEEAVEEDTETADEEEVTEDSSEGSDASLPVTILDSDDDEFKIDVNGTVLTFGATTYTTEFNKEIIQLDGMSFEYREEGQPAANAVFEDNHFLSKLSLVVEENLILDGDNVITRDINVEREIRLETSLLSNAGHVNEYYVHELDDSTPFDFYIQIEGDASKPGNFPDVIRGQEYRQYKFVEVTENGRYYVNLQFPIDVMEEFEATAIAIALSYQSLEADVEEATEETTEEVEETDEDQE
ncbi:MULTISPECIES: hypothetical protein [Bacillaceae]|uniref:Uncharacterized protein n=1 Tax=Evansella alkalicola TaxID=745819 RepID=A0ABS6JWB9_9BACI|nr:MULTISPECIES: hypothetical protein [Bacillaceae]MBU9722891.1 hypothetical protein [Bacillus alkalicola]